MSLLTLLEAANYLDSAETNASVPRGVCIDAGGGVEYERTPPVLLPDFHLDFGLSAAEASTQTPGGLDVQALRRSGGAGTREVHNKLEKYRRAQLKECFANLRQYINVPESRKLSNLSILRLAIRHIKSLNENHSHLRKILSKEKCEQDALKKIICHTLNFEIPNVIDGVPVASPSSASTDTATDEVDEDDEKMDFACGQSVSKSKDFTFSADAVAAQCPKIATNSVSSDILVFCQALSQAVTTTTGTTIIPPSVSASSAMMSFDADNLASSRKPIMAFAELLPATILAKPSVDSLTSAKEAVRAGSTARNSGAKTVIPRMSSETTPNFVPHGSSRPVVQMLQQTITQRAMVQQEKQRQMMNQGHEDKVKTLSDKGSISTGLKKMHTASLSQASSSSSFNNHSLPSQHSSASSVLLTPTSTAPSTAASVPLQFPVLLASPLATALGKASSDVAMVTTSFLDVTQQAISTAAAQQVVLPLTSLAGTSLAGASVVPSGVFLQLTPQGQLRTVQVRSADDFNQTCGGQLVAVYPMLPPSIPLTQLLNPVAVAPSNIPLLTAESGYQQQDSGVTRQTASKSAKLKTDEITTP